MCIVYCSFFFWNLLYLLSVSERNPQHTYSIHELLYVKYSVLLKLVRTVHSSSYVAASSWAQTEHSPARHHKTVRRRLANSTSQAQTRELRLIFVHIITGGPHFFRAPPPAQNNKLYTHQVASWSITIPKNAHHI